MAVNPTKSTYNAGYYPTWDGRARTKGGAKHTTAEILARDPAGSRLLKTNMNPLPPVTSLSVQEKSLHRRHKAREARYYANPGNVTKRHS